MHPEFRMYTQQILHHGISDRIKVQGVRGVRGVCVCVKCHEVSFKICRCHFSCAPRAQLARGRETDDSRNSTDRAMWDPVG